MNGIALRYWEKKILRWEFLRYSKWLFFYPLSWPLRFRMALAEKTILERLPENSRVLELGCGSGLLAEKLVGHCQSFLGVDIAANAIEVARCKFSGTSFRFVAGDAVMMDFPSVDLTVMLGFTDWISSFDLELIVSKFDSKSILMSYTSTRSFSPWNPYRIYREFMDRGFRGPTTGGGIYAARPCTDEEIEMLLRKHGYKFEIVGEASALNPGKMVWAWR